MMVDMSSQVTILQRQHSTATVRHQGGPRPALAVSQQSRARMRRDRAVAALGLEDTMQLPHGVLVELVQARMGHCCGSGVGSTVLSCVSGQVASGFYGQTFASAPPEFMIALVRLRS